MDILFLSPQPMYQDRGSPIAVDLVLQVLSKRGDQVDLVVYHEGEDFEYENITVHRIPNISLIRNIPPGFSWRKIICDILMIFTIIRLVLKKRYQVVHAVEEAVFFALLLNLIFKIPYVYDMDSSLAQQMVEQFPRLATFSFLLNFFEGLAVKHAEVVIPVCDALAGDISRYGPRKVVVIHDISLLEDVGPQRQNGLRAQLGTDGLVLMYVGNLQTYQGIDLLLESFALALNKTDQADLVIIGGATSDIEKYQQKSRSLGIHKRVHFLGPRPVKHLAAYLSQADILVSPRIKGKNTPMKIYSYLHSGKPLVATDIPTHTQVCDDQVAKLAKPSPGAFSEGMLHLIEDSNLRQQLGMAGKRLIEEKHSYPAFYREFTQLLDWLEVESDRKQQTVITTKRVSYSPNETVLR